MTRHMTTALLGATAISLALPAFAKEVNVYSYRQPELIKPLTDAFTAEGDRSPADLVLTVDISRLAEVVDAGLTQPVESDILRANVPDIYHDPEGHWWGLTTRARIIYASKDRVAEGEVTTYEDLTDPKWQ